MTAGWRSAGVAFAGLAVVAALAWLAAGGFGDLAATIQLVQRDLHRQLAAAMRALDAREAVAGWSLIGLSLLYGVFHAAGPGHGKAIIATYLATQESRLRRGIALSLLAALAQGVTAVVVVETAIGLLGLTMREAQGIEGGLEAASFGLIALVGAVLAAVNARRLFLGYRHDHHHHHHHDHDHHGDEGHGAHDAACGHAHGPTARDLEAAGSWRGVAAIVLSIGIRPCSGAILVLLLAHALDLRWAGIAAVFAMALGTAATMAALAALAVYARNAALRLAGRPDRDAGRLSMAVSVVGLAGGVVLAALGGVLMQAALTAPAHPLY